MRNRTQDDYYAVINIKKIRSYGKSKFIGKSGAHEHRYRSPFHNQSVEIIQPRNKYRRWTHWV